MAMRAAVDYHGVTATSDCDQGQQALVPSIPTSARVRPAPLDCDTRLLLDPYLCIGPGSEAHSDTVFQVAQRCARLGITLCVERSAWQEAASDPDVRRRQVDLSRFEPLVKLDALQVPSERDAVTRFVPARSEIDVADLKLLGALHARVASHLLAVDGRLHRLAARAGLASRVLTPADALHWLATLDGSAAPLVVSELDPREALASAGLAELIRRECEPYDPYLRARLELAHARTLVVTRESEPLALGVLRTADGGGHLELVALAAGEPARGMQVLEPIVAAALGIARTRNVPLEVLLPPHDELAALLLEQLGFARAEGDPHGRCRLGHEAGAWIPDLEAGATAWLLPLDVATHDRLLPELAGAAQARLFAVGANAPARTLASSPRKQLLWPAGGRLPAAGDLLLFYHGRAPRRPAASSITAVARVDRLAECTTVADVLAVNAARPCCTLADLQAQLAGGPLAVLDLTMLGRLERLLPLAQLKDKGVLNSAPRAPRALAADAWVLLAGAIALG